jgi:competence protein ComEC
MQHIIIGFFLFCISFFALATEYVTPSERVKNSMQVRASPDADGAILSQLNSGQELEYLGSIPYWHKVRLSPRKIGYVSKAWSEIIDHELTEGSNVNLAEDNFKNFYVDVVDVGTGLAMWIHNDNFNLIYDGGSQDDSSRFPNNRLINFIQYHQPELKRIDHLIVSHPHKDHISLLPDVLNHFKVVNVWDSGADYDSCIYAEFLSAVQKSTAEYHTATNNFGTKNVSMNIGSGCQFPATIKLNYASRINTEEKITLDKNINIQFLYATAEHNSDVNENSLVVKLTVGKNTFLLMGDAEGGAREKWLTNAAPEKNTIEADLLECCKAVLKADVLIAGHHGSTTSSRRLFLDAVSAHYFVISSGPHPYSGVTLPDQDIVTEFNKRGQLFSTTKDDDTCITNPAKIGTDADNEVGGCSNVRFIIGQMGVVGDFYSPHE